ncbi:hypothetical protein BVRB_042010, partial [Beta vulgaris subsp. vulgaris]
MMTLDRLLLSSSVESKAFDHLQAALHDPSLIAYQGSLSVNSTPPLPCLLVLPFFFVLEDSITAKVIRWERICPDLSEIKLTNDHLIMQSSPDHEPLFLVANNADEIQIWFDV